MWSCKPCSHADPTTDTLKIDMNKAAQVVAEEAKCKAVEAERLHAEAEQSRRTREAEERHRQQEVTAAEAEAAAQVAAAAEETRRRREDEVQQEQRRVAAEQAALQQQRQLELEEEQRLLQQTEDEQARERLDAWLQRGKFDGVNAKRKSLIKCKFPLHSAVKQKDLETVELLMRFGADPSNKDSNNVTPQQLAEKFNKDGSLTPIIHALGGC